MAPLGRAGVLALLALLAGGCGRRGDPTAPGLRLPAAPRAVEVSAPRGVLTLTWSAPREDLAGRDLVGPAGYEVLRSARPPGEEPCPGCPEDLEVAAAVDPVARRARGLTPTAWVEADPRPGWTYRYRVRALDPRGRAGPPSAPAEATWTPLAAPAVAVVAGDRQALVRVDRREPPPGLALTGLRVYGSGGRLLTEEGPEAEAIVVPRLANGVEERLSIHWVARTPRGWEVESPGAAAPVTPVDRVPPLPPAELVALPEPGGVRLRWLPAGGERYARVAVLRGEGAEPAAELARLPGHETGYLDTGLERGREYRYSVVAEDAAGNRSVPTPEVRVRAR